MKIRVEHRLDTEEITSSILVSPTLFYLHEEAGSPSGRPASCSSEWLTACPSLRSQFTGGASVLHI